MEKEIWRDIPGYEGLYQVSNHGRVKSCVRIVNSKSIKGRTVKECILKPDMLFGYLKVTLSKECGKKRFPVHRLVAMAFIPNPKCFPCVNHKDEDKQNNCVSNLEWCTHKYNSNYGTIRERLSKKHLNHPTKSKQVEQVDANGNHIASYPSIKEAGRQLKIPADKISQVCLRHRKSTKGYYFNYL